MRFVHDPPTNRRNLTIEIIDNIQAPRANRDDSNGDTDNTIG